MKKIKENTVQIGDCLMWTAGCHAQGYPMMRNPETSKMVLVTRYLMQQKTGRTFTRDTRVKSTCNNVKCVNIDHYEVVERDDMERWKCTPHQVKKEIREQIKKEYLETEHYHGFKRDLKRKYNITYGTLSNILKA